MSSDNVEGELSVGTGAACTRAPSSPLQEWIANRDNAISPKWVSIGRDVYSRKSLILASRDELVARGVKGNALNLAATDVFVEKAQSILARRARVFLILGIAAGCGAVATSLCVAGFIYMHSLKSLFDGLPVNPQTVMLIVFRSSSAGIFVGIAIYFMVALSRALLHEGVGLYSRRHALRFGRLYVYLRGGEVGLQELEEAFHWNREFQTAFTQIELNKMPKSPVQRVAEAPVEMAKVAAGALKTVVNRKRAGRGAQRNGDA